MLLAHLNQPPLDARRVTPDVPESVSMALRRAMAKDPEERFVTAGEFVAALH